VFSRTLGAAVFAIVIDHSTRGYTPRFETLWLRLLCSLASHKDSVDNRKELLPCPDCLRFVPVRVSMPPYPACTSPALSPVSLSPLFPHKKSKNSGNAFTERHRQFNISILLCFFVYNACSNDISEESVTFVFFVLLV